jgi:hypothetical protein
VRWCSGTSRKPVGRGWCCDLEGVHRHVLLSENFCHSWEERMLSALSWTLDKRFEQPLQCAALAAGSSSSARSPASSSLSSTSLVPGGTHWIPLHGRRFTESEDETKPGTTYSGINIIFKLNSRTSFRSPFPSIILVYI